MKINKINKYEQTCKIRFYMDKYRKNIKKDNIVFFLAANVHMYCSFNILGLVKNMSTIQFFIF